MFQSLETLKDGFCCILSFCAFSFRFAVIGKNSYEMLISKEIIRFSLGAGFSKLE